MIKRVFQCIILFFTITIYTSSNPEATTIIPAEHHPNAETSSPTQKIAYLTFDDGPNKYTMQILNILKEKNGKATFFVIGGKVPHYQKTMQRLIKDGHYIGLHSMSHDVKRLYTGDPSTLITEMEQTQNIVQQVTKLNTHLVRVPYGSMPYLKKNYRDALVSARYKMWDWTIDTYDWKSYDNPSAILERVRNQSDEQVEVILMHDSSVTVQILPKVIDYLQSQGYKLLPYNPSSHLEVNFWKDTRL
ncbi:polysaccharide deacetylase family protein [Bacillus toyonensis]|jgi:peptidoglycan/xylan/chitin deacetylase (PgdA/CDA1 family)|uniref:polysaccharide deacetylase family protein n=1 Tax=Bacillus toyonensis TaxID=155322 RepID=UPI000BF228E9|nr:polysaccharide deacetylase family protein [Bacillus toyonensis]PEK51403.1 peptidoglycan-N-acetylglucosamine deacetylase [Bacillus toyonensis]PFZ77937.1 peptidoglycan-N-acetylglucosamine deacetylase [Bacillus toyonensis]PGB40205.1 peptidoglycan-N-acetylglucosamine deacetylase [Bacillus toyonensis]PHE89249.1 peptidoglycan-N-acetylglucosamine deacetylase [Bacillus toyonensis]PHG11726.1 peptidoglycan-N-acetylglucosamine deacetylase [Bacillus toyonensis]